MKTLICRPRPATLTLAIFADLNATKTSCDENLQVSLDNNWKKPSKYDFCQGTRRPVVIHNLKNKELYVKYQSLNNQHEGGRFWINITSMYVKIICPKWSYHLLQGEGCLSVSDFCQFCPIPLWQCEAICYLPSQKKFWIPNGVQDHPLLPQYKLL